jgi:hypothetical protein
MSIGHQELMGSLELRMRTFGEFSNEKVLLRLAWVCGLNRAQVTSTLVGF